MIEFSAQQIADFLKGSIIGDPEVKVNNLSKIEDGKPGTLTFLSNPKYTQYIYETNASIVLVNNSFEPEKAVKATLIKVEDSYKALSLLLNLVAANMPKPAAGISPLAFVSETAKIGKDVYIGEFAYIGNGAEIADGARIYPQTFIGHHTKIGKDTTLYAGVKIYDNCVVGANCILHSGCVLGADGFGFVPEKDGSWSKLPQIGNVYVEDNVEIGANTTIDRSTMGSTHIHKDVKLDNLVHIAHNVEIGDNTAMAAQCGIAGSTKIGKNCILAGQVGIVGHISIANRTIFGAQSGCSRTVKNEGEMLMGYPVRPLMKYKRITAIEHKLPEIYEEFNALKKEVEELKKKLNS